MWKFVRSWLKSAGYIWIWSGQESHLVTIHRKKELIKENKKERKKERKKEKKKMWGHFEIKTPFGSMSLKEEFIKERKEEQKKERKKEKERKKR